MKRKDPSWKCVSSGRDEETTKGKYERIFLKNTLKESNIEAPQKMKHRNTI